MLLKNPLLKGRPFVLAASGTAAEAAESEVAEGADDGVPDAGETTPRDEKGRFASAKGESEEAPADDEPAGDEAAEAAEEVAAEQAAAVAGWSPKDFGMPEDREQARAYLQQLHADRAAAAELRQWVAWQRQQAQQQQQQPAATEKPKLPWDIPEFDPRMIELLTKDEDGNLVAKPGAIPTLPQDYQRWVRAREDAVNKFLSDPYGTLQGGLMPLIQREAQRIVEQQFRQQQQTQALESYKQANAQWLFDQFGQLTPAGQKADQFYREAVQAGHPNPVYYADRMMNAEMADFMFAQQQQQAAAQAAKPAPKAQRDRDFLKSHAGRQPSRGAPTNGRRRVAASANGKDAFEALRKRWAGRGSEDFEDLVGDDEDE